MYNINPLGGHIPPIWSVSVIQEREHTYLTMTESVHSFQQNAA